VASTNSLLINSSAYAKRPENDNIGMDGGYDCGGYSLDVSPAIAGRRVYTNSSFGGGSEIYVLMQPGSHIGGPGFIGLEYTANTWVLVYAVIEHVCTTRIDVISTNPSTNPDFIPTTGWSPAITAAPEIGSDNPANAAEPDATAYVLIDGPFYNTPGNAGSGFVGGQSWRKMQPGVAVNGRASYSYGNEGVNWTGTQWQYTNTSTGVISSSLSDVAYPWLATAWTNGYSAAKVTSTYNKTTNYPAVP